MQGTHFGAEERVQPQGSSLCSESSQRDHWGQTARPYPKAFLPGFGVVSHVLVWRERLLNV